MTDERYTAALRAACAHPAEDPRSGLYAPFVFGPHTFATDGKVILWVLDDSDNWSNCSPVDAGRLVAMMIDAEDAEGYRPLAPDEAQRFTTEGVASRKEWIAYAEAMAAWQDDPTLKCRKCGGSGFIESPTHGDMGQCESCHGSGIGDRIKAEETMPAEPVRLATKIDGLTFDLRFLRVLGMIGPVEITTGQYAKRDALFFRSTDRRAEGLVMAIKETQDDD